MKILITGGLGFIGTHLERELLLKKHDVTIFDRERINRLRYIRGDICDYSRLEYAFDKTNPDIMVHLAAMVSRMESEETPYMAIQTNIDGTLNVARLCEKYNTRLIYAGSSEEYGTAFDGGQYVDEDTPFGYPTSMYSMTKRMSEEIVQYYAHFKGITATTMRFFMLYGPGEKENDYRSAMIRFIDAARAGTPIEVHKGTIRQWCYISDAVKAMMHIINDAQVAPYEVYNIGNGQAITTERLAVTIKELTHSNSPIVLTEPGETIIPVKLASFDKMGEKFGWKATVDLERGIRQVIGAMNWGKC